MCPTDDDGIYSYFYHLREVAYWYLNDIGQAHKDFDLSVQLGIDDGHVYYGLGFIGYSLGAYELAIGHFTKCLEIFDKYGEAYYNCGLAYRR